MAFLPYLLKSLRVKYKRGKLFSMGIGKKTPAPQNPLNSLISLR